MYYHLVNYSILLSRLPSSDIYSGDALLCDSQAKERVGATVPRHPTLHLCEWNHCQHMNI